MHPREGWKGDGPPPIARLFGQSDQQAQPTARADISRRGFLRQGAGAGLLLGAGAGGAGSLLAACGGTPKSGPTTIPLPRPNNRVTWPIFADNKPIKSGLQPEQGATLQIYNWVAYINEAVVKNFCKKYNCSYKITTFNNIDEMLAKLRSGQTNFDIVFPTIDALGELVYGKMIRPVNHSYVPNIHQAWSDFTDPFYDGKWQYTVPYTIYTTGMAWRKDHVPENPYGKPNSYGWAMPWQAKYRDKVAILDDAREGISLGLMKNGIFNLNTTSPSRISAAGSALVDLAHLTNVHFDNNDFTEVPGGQIWIHHAWSGDIASAASYMQKGVNVDVVGYWFPPDGTGPVGNDLITVLRTAQNPVLAHLFQNYFLDFHNAVENYSYTGYMQPITGITPQLLVQQKLLPPSLMSTTVLPSYFRRGVMELQLPVSANTLWEQAWLQAKNA